VGNVQQGWLETALLRPNAAKLIKNKTTNASKPSSIPMSSAPGKLSPLEFLAELQSNIGRPRAPGAANAGQPLAKGAGSGEAAPRTAAGNDTSIAAALFNAGSAGGDLATAELDDAEVTAETDGASTPAVAEPSEPPASARNNPLISGLLNRVDSLLGAAAKPSDGPFFPKAPESLAAAGLTFEDVERIILKFLLSRGSATGRAIASQISLSFMLVEPLLKSLKYEQLVVFKSSAAMGDYEYLLTDNGRDRARRYVAECTYFGAATVTLKDYLKAMAAQSIAKQHATEDDLQRAFSLGTGDQFWSRYVPVR
jgi:hypothetical protein